MQSRLYRTGWKLLDLLFPPQCAGCGSWGKRYCPECFSRTQLIQNPICQICGDPLEPSENVICGRCRTGPVSFTAVRSWGVFADPLQSAIHNLKYRQNRGLGEVLAQPLVGLLNRYRWGIDLIIPVPLDKERRRQRGYNQAALLARPIAWETGIRYAPEGLMRVRTTRAQVGLSMSERVENMAGAFKAKSDVVSGRNIWVIDDVITTGSTINACANALINSGAEQVYGMTLARSAHI